VSVTPYLDLYGLIHPLSEALSVQHQTHFPHQVFHSVFLQRKVIPAQDPLAKIQTDLQRK